MLWFENRQKGSIVCMETTLVGDARIQTVLGDGFYRYQIKRDPNAHNHLNCEIYFVEQGTCRTWCDGRIYTCCRNDLLVIPAGADHNVQQLSRDASMYSLRFFLFPQSPAQEGPGVYRQLMARLEKPIQLEGQERLLELLNRLRRELAQQNFLCAEIFRGLLQVFYGELIREILGFPGLTQGEKAFSIVLDPECPRGLEGYRKAAPPEYYMDIMDDFFTHLPQSRPTLEELSARVHLSISQTQRLVRKCYGMSFRQKLAKTRIEYSKRLMAATELSLEAISEQTGYSSYNAFFEAFTGQSGQTPSQYRQSLRGKPEAQPGKEEKNRGRSGE